MGGWNGGRAIDDSENEPKLYDKTKRGCPLTINSRQGVQSTHRNGFSFCLLWGRYGAVNAFAESPEPYILVSSCAIPNARAPGTRNSLFGMGFLRAHFLGIVTIELIRTQTQPTNMKPFYIQFSPFAPWYSYSSIAIQWCYDYSTVMHRDTHKGAANGMQWVISVYCLQFVWCQAVIISPRRTCVWDDDFLCIRLA